MKQCVLTGHGLLADNIFQLDSPGNRDDCYKPYTLLVRQLREYGYEIHTQDRLTSSPAFSLHMNVQPAGGSSVRSYLLLLETPTIQPANRHISEHYRKVFTWRDDLVDGDRFIKFNFPNLLVAPDVDGFAARDRFCCVIAGNKAVVIRDPRELYSERVRAIRWFERNTPLDFDLYGTDWDLPPARPGFAGMIKKRLWRFASRHFRPTVARSRASAMSCAARASRSATRTCATCLVTSQKRSSTVSLPAACRSIGARTTSLTTFRRTATSTTGNLSTPLPCTHT
jgi:hypothetical protein